MVDFPDDGLDLPAYLFSIERDLIQRSLQRTGGNRNKAAELLRIKRTTLVEKLKRMGTE
jgi:sigma-54 specific flagellar transcriptional regulator A